MLKALRNRPLSLLWIGQVTSAIGDEIYRVALIWLAVGLIGADTGYLAAGQSAALLALSLFGGKWSDRWDICRTLIGVDVFRALIVLIPVVLFHFMPLSLTLLWVVALTLSGLSAFFEPALQGALPSFAPDNETLQAATGLMSTTFRIARAIGPGIVGLLSGFIPMIHFFTLDAVTFGASALSVAMMKSHPSRKKHANRDAQKTNFRESLLSGFRLIRHSRTMRYIIFVKAVAGGSWNLAYGLGLALLVQKIAPHDMRAFGLVIASYGVGNLAAALVVGNMRRPRPATMMFWGYAWMGFGFLLVAASPNIPCLMMACALTAIGGPLNDLPFLDIIQARYAIRDIPKVFRLRMAVETAATLVFMVMSPLMLRWLSVTTVIALCGFATLAVGAYGAMKYSDKPAGQADEELSDEIQTAFK